MKVAECEPHVFKVSVKIFLSYAPRRTVFEKDKEIRIVADVGLGERQDVC